MTGRYPIRSGMQYGVIIPGAPWGLPLSEKVGRQDSTKPAERAGNNLPADRLRKFLMLHVGLDNVYCREEVTFRSGVSWWLLQVSKLTCFLFFVHFCFAICTVGMDWHVLRCSSKLNRSLCTSEVQKPPAAEACTIAAKMGVPLVWKPGA